MERDHLEDLVVGWRIVLRWIFKKWDGEARIGLLWLRIGAGGGACECGNKIPGFMKCGEFLDQLRTG